MDIVHHYPIERSLELKGIPQSGIGNWESGGVGEVCYQVVEESLKKRGSGLFGCLIFAEDDILLCLVGSVWYTYEYVYIYKV